VGTASQFTNTKGGGSRERGAQEMGKYKQKGPLQHQGGIESQIADDEPLASRAAAMARVENPRGEKPKKKSQATKTATPWSPGRVKDSNAPGKRTLFVEKGHGGPEKGRTQSGPINRL